MELDRKIALLRKALGPIRDDKSHKGELLFTCPKCQHEKNKLCIDIENDRFHCWHCHWGHKSSLEGIIWLTHDRDAIDEYVGQKKRHVEIKRQFAKPYLPNEAFSLCDPNRQSLYTQHAFRFLERRGITREMVELYKLSFAEEGRYRYRVIMPSFDANGELNFFVGRTIYDDVKYLHDMFDKNIIFNDIMVDWTEPVILTEGPFDAMRMGTNAIAIQGTFMSESSKLFTKIVTTGVPVYLALDSDARAHRLRIAKLLLSYGVSCLDVPLLGKKDPGEMTAEQARVAISCAKPINGNVDLLRARFSL